MHSFLNWSINFHFSFSLKLEQSERRQILRNLVSNSPFILLNQTFLAFHFTFYPVEILNPWQYSMSNNKMYFKAYFLKKTFSLLQKMYTHCLRLSQILKIGLHDTKTGGRFFLKLKSECNTVQHCDPSLSWIAFTCIKSLSRKYISVGALCQCTKHESYCHFYNVWILS